MRWRNSLALPLVLAGCGQRLPPPPNPADVAGPGLGPRLSAPTPDYDEVGIASWYGEALAGRPIASGKPFDPDAMTAAHLTLPLGSFVEVTSLDTGKVVLVEITDRGPYGKNRLIDLSRAAAAALDIDGIGPVRVRAVTPTPADRRAIAGGNVAAPRLDAPAIVLAALRRRLAGENPGPTAPPKAGKRTLPPSGAYSPPPSAKPPLPTGAGGYYVQVGTFGVEANARSLARRLNGQALPAGRLFRVRLGPFATRQNAERARDAAARDGYADAAVLRQD